jgi:hypothetical protein
VFVRNYPGGHMTYLDDTARVRQKADLVSFYAGTLAALATAPRKQPLAAPLAGSALRPGHDRVGTSPATPRAVQPEAAVQTLRVEPWAPADQVQRALRESPRAPTQPQR